MTDTYNDTTGSRKKFLIPLVVLLLCAVSLTGAGYAYNSSVQVDNNNLPDSDWIKLDLDGTPAAAIVPNTTASMVMFTDYIKYTWNNALQTPAYEKTNEVKYEVVEGEIYHYNFEITGTVDTAIVNVSSEDLATALDIEIGELKLSDMIAFKIGTSSDIAQAVDFDPAGTNLTVNYDAEGATHNGRFTAYLFIVQGSDATGIVQTEKDTAIDPIVPDDYAAAYKALADAAPAFTLLFTADTEAPAPNNP